ncbi:MAG TPA: hypothetical protein VD978_11775 [Azospirillum sp.]|nr:hypothetical protein [Azospirillum sp.]
MPTHRDNRTDKPSVIDLVTDPEKFDQWQHQREREEAADNQPTDDGRENRRPTEEPRDRPPDRD